MILKTPSIQIHPYSENTTKSTVIKQPTTIKSLQLYWLTIKDLAQYDLKHNRAASFSGFETKQQALPSHLMDCLFFGSTAGKIV